MFANGVKTIRCVRGTDSLGEAGESETRTTDVLRDELAREDLARHLALFYQSPQNQLEVAATFVKHGPRTGNRCLYVVDTNTRPTVERAFRTAGIDVERGVENGDLLSSRDGTRTTRRTSIPTN